MGELDQIQMDLGKIYVSLCWYSFRYGDVLPCDSLPSLIFTLLEIYKIINDSSAHGGVNHTPTLMPKSVQTIYFLESINNLRA
jgi:hypothetical protein